MAVIGALIKGLINLRGVVIADSEPEKEQEKVLRQLLQKAKDTAFGEHYKFQELLDADDIRKAFSEQIPFFDYNKIHREWWSKLHQGQENVTWPGKPPYYALSSGTTGKTSKRIPVTDDMLEAIRQTGIKQVGALTNYELSTDFFEKEIMMLGSSTGLQQVEDHQEGEISGISASNIPFWFRSFYKPGMEIAQIDDWDERVMEIAKKAPDWDIGAITGIPTWTELMIKKIIEYHKVETIHDIWPNLEVYSTGGVAFDTYEKSFNELLARPVTVIDTYLASEGFLAFQERPQTSSMRLVTDNGIYFEFVPFKAEYIQEDGALVPDAPLVLLRDVREGEEYVLVISTVAGLWRYIIGDTIAFTDVDRKEIKITGRTKFFQNTLGEQLSVNKMNQAVKELESNFSIKIPEFTLAVTRNEKGFIHRWYLGVIGQADEAKMAMALDEGLQDANKAYKSARGKALKAVEVVILSPEVFYQWNALNKKKGGQVKMEKVMKDDKLSQWEAFLNQGLETTEL